MVEKVTFNVNFRDHLLSENLFTSFEMLQFLSNANYFKNDIMEKRKFEIIYTT